MQVSDKLTELNPRRFAAIRFRWIDLVLVCALAIAAFALVWHSTHRISIGLRNENAANVWFESDVSRVFYNLSARGSNQYRSTVHPIFALVANRICYVFHKVLRFDLNESADLFLAFTAMAWTVLMYLVARLLAFDRVLALCAGVLGLVSSSGMLFFSVPETYSLASVSILGTLALYLATRGTRREKVGAVLASAASLSITVTNWSLGLLLTFRRKTWRKWIQLSANAFVLVTALWTVERAMMPTAQFFTELGAERKFANRPTLSSAMHTGVVVAFHSVIAPAVRETSDFGKPGELVGPAWKSGLTFQNAWPGSGSPWGVAAIILWGAVLLLGVTTLLRKHRTQFALSVLIYLVLQYLLHVLYGLETFMYALDWMPVLIIIALYGVQELKWARWPAAIVLAALLAVNNYGQFQRITGLIDSYQKANPLAPPTTEKEMYPVPCVVLPKS